MNRSDPSVSVIIAAFNQERYIGRCLRSLLHQTMDAIDYEVIVIDDGSTDKTPYALGQFESSNMPLIRVMRNSSNIGLPASLNKGIHNARGKYIVRVDSDDFVNKHYLSFLHYFLDANSHIDAVACDYLVVDDSENVVKRCACKENPIGCGIMFKREDLIEIGMYDETFRLHEERELRVRFEASYKMSFLELPLYRYRRHESNMTSDKVQMDLHMKMLKDKYQEYEE